MTADVEAYLAAGTDRYVDDLKQWCTIPSVSTQPAHKADVERAARYAAGLLQRAGLDEVTLHPTPGHPLVTAAWQHAAGQPEIRDRG
jgi:acetylornithine deacetylase/succinyl-diaminopimelate desuccinylase-like protein